MAKVNGQRKADDAVAKLVRLQFIAEGASGCGGLGSLIGVKN